MSSATTGHPRNMSTAIVGYVAGGMAVLGTAAVVLYDGTSIVSLVLFALSGILALIAAFTVQRDLLGLAVGLFLVSVVLRVVEIAVLLAEVPDIGAMAFPFVFALTGGSPYWLLLDISLVLSVVAIVLVLRLRGQSGRQKSAGGTTSA